MRICELISGYGGKMARREVNNLAFRLDSVDESTLYFCLKGNKEEAQKAISYGAVAVVSPIRLASVKQSITVDNARSALALASKRLNASCCDRLAVHAVTGTNGKTTTAFMLRRILNGVGKATALIGTNGIYIGDDRYENPLTTPDAPLLHATFSECFRRGITDVVMEASAHALRLNKLDGITFTTAGFTNLSRDHLDFFSDMDDYKAAKLTLFSTTKNTVTNLGNETGREIARGKNALTYGEGGVLCADNVRLSLQKIVFTAHYAEKTAECEISTAGRYNVDNSLCAIGMAMAAGVDFKAAVGALNGMSAVDGRMNIISRNGLSVAVDFAHTDDGLSNLLRSVRQLTEGRVITVFGCGGNRDRTKRPIMGRVASELSDVVIITEDNPRYESTEQIIGDILNGIKGTEEVDYYIRKIRTDAVRLAIELAKPGDTVVLAGKGAENSIERSGVLYPYSDLAEAEKRLKEKKFD